MQECALQTSPCNFASLCFRRAAANSCCLRCKLSQGSISSPALVRRLFQIRDSLLKGWQPQLALVVWANQRNRKGCIDEGGGFSQVMQHAPAHKTHLYANPLGRLNEQPSFSGLSFLPSQPLLPPTRDNHALSSAAVHITPPVL